MPEHRRYRGPLGSRHEWARLHEDDIYDMRCRYADGEAQTALADEFGVSVPHVSAIVNGRKWRHVGGPIGVRPARRGRLAHAHQRHLKGV